MSFQAYIDNIKLKTGKGPEDFKKLANEKGFTQDGKIALGVNATDVTNWLKQEFELGHGHAMAIFALLKGDKERN